MGFHLCINHLTVRRQPENAKCWCLCCVCQKSLVPQSLEILVFHGLKLLVVTPVDAMLRHTNQMKHTEQSVGQQPLPAQALLQQLAPPGDPNMDPVPELIPALEVHAKHQDFCCLGSAAALHPSLPTRGWWHCSDLASSPT